MHWTQGLYLILLIAALWHGKAGPRLTLAMLGNVAATMALASDPVTVGVADTVAAAVLIGGNAKARIVATLFSVMLPVYVSAHVFSWSSATTYAIIDLLAFVQLGVICGASGGIRRGLWRGFGAGNPRGAASGRPALLAAFRGNPETKAGHADCGVAGISAAARRLGQP